MAAALVISAGGMLVGCGDDRKDSEPAPSSSPTAARTVPTHTRIAHVEGKLGTKARKRVRARVGSAVDAWFVAAYLGGDYPRGSSAFTRAFPGFTPGARAVARKRLGIMSNAAIAKRIDTVTPVVRLVALDVIAAKGRAAGVTARVKLVFRTAGDLVSRQVVRGQLDLTPYKGKWRVFAFDVTKRGRTGAKGSAAPKPKSKPKSKPTSKSTSKPKTKPTAKPSAKGTKK